jgi:fission process protein 1
MLAAQRYVAYTSDIGESFRPVAHPNLIRTAYGISWLYLTGDVLHEGYKAYIANQAMLRGGHSVSDIPEFLQPQEPSATTTTAKDVVNSLTTPAHNERSGNILKPVGNVGFLEDYRTVMVQRAVFQSLASMAFPAFTIHSVRFTMLVEIYQPRD